MSGKRYFSPEVFSFLSELRKNNTREWFLADKQRYEAVGRDPFLRFIEDFGSRLRRISPCFLADPRPVGGSLFRIYRDIRFSKDKSPYKTHIAAHFPHRSAGKDVHAPGFYLHLEPGNCFAAAGLWHPDPRALEKVRGTIVARPQEWASVRRSRLPLEGEVLARPPRGYDRVHLFIEDLKRKDFVTTITFSEKQVYDSNFLQDFVAACRKMSPLVRFLTRALRLAW